MHVAFWVGYLVFFSLLWGSYADNYAKEFVVVLLELPVKISICYINLYLLMPRLLYKQRYLPYILGLFGAVILAGIAQRVTWVYFLYPLYYQQEVDVVFWSIPKINKYIVTINSL